jgi:hypothetical protein
LNKELNKELDKELNKELIEVLLFLNSKRDKNIYQMKKDLFSFTLLKDLM